MHVLAKMTVRFYPSKSIRSPRTRRSKPSLRAVISDEQVSFQLNRHNLLAHLLIPRISAASRLGDPTNRNVAIIRDRDALSDRCRKPFDRPTRRGAAVITHDG